jgi:hypothetical protein
MESLTFLSRHTVHFITITKSMEQSPSWEANSNSPSQETPRILQKSPSLVPILSHMNQVHNSPPYFSKILSNVILPPTPKSSVTPSSFNPIQNNRSNYSSLYVNLYVSREETGRQKIPNRMVASIPWTESALNFFVNAILTCYYRSQVFELFHIFEGFINC